MVKVCHLSASLLGVWTLASSPLVTARERTKGSKGPKGEKGVWTKPLWQVKPELQDLKENCLQEGDELGLTTRNRVRMSEYGRCSFWNNVRKAYFTKPDKHPGWGDYGLHRFNFVAKKEIWKIKANFCRNPDEDEAGPWCYTKYNSTFEKSYCSIPNCVDVDLSTCYTDKRGRNYNGKMSTTESGNECLPWHKDKWPYGRRGKANKMGKYAYKAARKMKHNYCRNPTKIPRDKKNRSEAARPWCFTNNPNNTNVWEYCDISKCGGGSGGGDLPTSEVCGETFTGRGCINVDDEVAALPLLDDASLTTFANTHFKQNQYKLNTDQGFSKGDQLKWEYMDPPIPHFHNYMVGAGRSDYGDQTDTIERMVFNLYPTYFPWASTVTYLDWGVGYNTASSSKFNELALWNMCELQVLSIIRFTNTHLSAKLFATNKKLRHLQLDYLYPSSGVNYFDKDTFQCLPVISSLQVGHARLRQFEPGTFSNLATLNYFGIPTIEGVNILKVDPDYDKSLNGNIRGEMIFTKEEMPDMVNLKKVYFQIARKNSGDADTEEELTSCFNYRLYDKDTGANADTMLPQSIVDDKNLSSTCEFHYTYD